MDGGRVRAVGVGVDGADILDPGDANRVGCGCGARDILRLSVGASVLGDGLMFWSIYPFIRDISNPIRFTSANL